MTISVDAFFVQFDDGYVRADDVSAIVKLGSGSRVVLRNRATLDVTDAPAVAARKLAIGRLEAMALERAGDASSGEAALPDPDDEPPSDRHAAARAANGGKRVGE